MSSLFEIRSNIEKVINNGFIVDEETGEIIFDEENLEILFRNLTDKVEGCAQVIKQYEAFASSIRDEEKKLAERRRAYENRAERLKQYILDNITENAIETPRCRVTTRNNQRVEVIDEDALPVEYIREKTTREVDKNAIKADIKAGKSVPGATLVITKSLLIK